MKAIDRALRVIEIVAKVAGLLKEQEINFYNQPQKVVLTWGDDTNYIVDDDDSDFEGLKEKNNVR